MARALDVRALILGDTGVGKELVARAIHRLGSRRKKPFIALNCGGIVPELALSELFGHVRGAFTTAVTNRQGALREASGGVLFLDEIADLPAGVQSQLLRVLEQRTFSPIGFNEVFKLDSQILSATNRDLSTLVERGDFRADLYFRVAQITIRIPSLAERENDLDLLVRHFWLTSSPTKRVDPGLLAAVKGRRWSGNVRQLRSAVERVMLLRAAGDSAPVEEILDASSNDMVGQGGALAEMRADYDRRVLEAVLRRTGHDTAAAARELGVTRRTIYNLLRKTNAQRP
jgi:DNA-binding NtrC family response regulator